MLLYDVNVNETPKFQCLEPTNLSHTISAKGNKGDYVLVIPLDLHGVVSFLKLSNQHKKNMKALNIIHISIHSATRKLT
jgi:hypothetical protein